MRAVMLIDAGVVLKREDKMRYPSFLNDVQSLFRSGWI